MGDRPVAKHRAAAARGAITGPAAPLNSAGYVSYERSLLPVSMHQLKQHDRLYGLALSETPHAHRSLALWALAAILIQAGLVAAHLLLPGALSRWDALLPAGHEALIDMTSSTSLAAWFAGALYLLAALICLALARIDRPGDKPSGVWKWGALAFGILALDAACNLSGFLAAALEAGIAGWTLDAHFFVPAAFLLLFGGFFAIALWRLRSNPWAAFAVLLGYAAWGLSWTGLQDIEILQLHLDERAQAAVVPALAMLGTTLILWAFAGNLFRSARRATPLALRQRPRLL